MVINLASLSESFSIAFVYLGKSLDGGNLDEIPSDNLGVSPGDDLGQSS